MKVKLNKTRDETSSKITVPSTGKKVPADLQPPKFSFQYLEKNYCFSKCTKEEKLSFAEKMFLLSHLTWAQIRQLDRHKLGFEKIEKHEIKTSIPTHITEDVHLIAFRFYNKAPMVGYKDKDGTFYIIWFDRNFTLYKH